MARQWLGAAVTGVVMLGSVATGCAQESDLDLSQEGDGADGSADPNAVDEEPAVPEDVAATLEDAMVATTEVETAALLLAAEVDTPGGSTSATLDAQLEGEQAHLVSRVTAGGEEIELELLTIPETTLVTSEQSVFTEALPEGATWVEVPEDEVGRLVLAADLAEAWRILPVLRGVDEMEDLGVEEVGGDPVRMLAGDVDFEAAYQAASPEEQDGLDATIRSAEDGRDYRAQVGLDGDGRVRYLEVVATLTGPEGEDAEATYRLEVTSFGEEVELPPAPAEDERVAWDEAPDIRSLLADIDL